MQTVNKMFYASIFNGEKNFYVYKIIFKMFNSKISTNNMYMNLIVMDDFSYSAMILKVNIINSSAFYAFFMFSIRLVQICQASQLTYGFSTKVRKKI